MRSWQPGGTLAYARLDSDPLALPGMRLLLLIVVTIMKMIMIIMMVLLARLDGFPGGPPGLVPVPASPCLLLASGGLEYNTI